MVATDGGKDDAKRTLIPVEINISDINDNAPVFEVYPFEARVPMSTQPGQNVIKIKATDADHGPNGEIVYTFLREQDKPKFRIHPSTGVVTATSSLAQENGKVYHLEVLARDKGNPPLSARGLIKIRVGDLGESTPVLKFQNDTYEVIVQENSSKGTEVLQVTAVRSDGRRQRISYSIGTGNDFRSFDIDEESGLIRVNNPTRLDAELWNDLSVSDITADVGDERAENSWGRSLDGQQAKESPRESSRHVLTLVARTTGPEPLEAYAKLIVRVSDINDNPPIFTQSQYSATVLEGNSKGDFVVKVSD